MFGGSIINCLFDFTIVCWTWIGTLDGDGGILVGVTLVSLAGFIILHKELLLGDAV